MLKVEASEVVEICHPLRFGIYTQWWGVCVNTVEKGGGVDRLSTLKEDLQADVGDEVDASFSAIRSAVTVHMSEAVRRTGVESIPKVVDSALGERFRLRAFVPSLGLVAVPQHLGILVQCYGKIADESGAGDDNV